jgi:hypothetical protein
VKRRPKRKRELNRKLPMKKKKNGTVKKKKETMIFGGEKTKTSTSTSKTTTSNSMSTRMLRDSSVLLRLPSMLVMRSLRQSTQPFLLLTSQTKETQLLSKLLEN